MWQKLLIAALALIPAEACAIPSALYFAALSWLSRHQSADGAWHVDFTANCKGDKCSTPGRLNGNAAAIAASVLPFLAAGCAHKSESPQGPFAETVRMGLRALSC